MKYFIFLFTFLFTVNVLLILNFLSKKRVLINCVAQKKDKQDKIIYKKVSFFNLVRTKLKFNEYKKITNIQIKMNILNV